MKRINLVGQKFGKLKVEALAGKNKWGNLLFECLCDCGKKSVVAGGTLRGGHTISCGCYGYNIKFTHNMSRSPLYRIYYAIKQRCENPKYGGYHFYGAKGRKCFWKSFEEFKNDMHEGYLEHIKKFGKDTEIDRINNNGHYSKDNCRWVTRKENLANRFY